MTNLVLVRHGESKWNRVCRLQGHFDSPLTDLGIAQAKSVSFYLSGILINQHLKIYTSPLKRAYDTAKIIAKELHNPRAEVVIEERIKDFNLGNIAGICGWDKVAELFPEQARLRLQNPLHFHPPGGESGTDFEARLRCFLNELEDDGITKLLVSHGIVNKFIRGIHRNLNGAEIIEFGESQDTIYRLDNDGERQILLNKVDKTGCEAKSSCQSWFKKL